jgi:hypothetical protein
MNPYFETMEDYFGRLPKSEQKEIRAGSKLISTQIKQARANFRINESKKVTVKNIDIPLRNILK